MKKLSIIACGFFVVQSLTIAQTDSAPAPTESDLAPESASATADSTPAPSAAPAQSQYTPLTQSERFHHYIRGTFSVESVIRSAAGAAILQGTNTPSEWGQGGEGYAKRFGNSFTQQIMRQTIMYGAADALHEDNRYVASGRSGTGARLKYAVESTFLARKDDGTRRLSYSRLGSYVAVAFLSRQWQPPSTSGPGSAGLSFGTTVGSEVGFNIAREFWPKIFKPH
jgi:hypothetical protein